MKNTDIYALAHDLTDKLAKGSESSDKIWAELRGYISNPFAESKFTAVVNQLLAPNRTRLKEELIEPFLASFFEGVKSKLDMVLLSLQLELFLYLGRFEDHLKNILQYADIGVSVFSMCLKCDLTVEPEKYTVKEKLTRKELDIGFLLFSLYGMSASYYFQPAMAWKNNYATEICCGVQQ